jgi:hypothetical protein
MAIEFLDDVKVEAGLEVTGTLNLKSASAIAAALHFHPPFSNAFSVSLQAPTLLASTAYTLPDADGTTKQVLSTNGSAILSWNDNKNIGLDNLIIPGTDTVRTLTLSAGTNASFIIESDSNDPYIECKKEVTDIYKKLRILPNSTDGGVIQIYEGTGLNDGYVGLKVGASHTTSIDYTLPVGPPASNKFLQSTSLGIMSWQDAGSAINIGNTSLAISGTNTSRVLTLSSGGSSNFAIDDYAGNERFRITASETTVTGALTMFSGNSSTGGSINLKEGSTYGGEYIKLQAPSSLAATNIYTLPSAYPTTGQVLSSTDAGIMSWEDAGSGGDNISNTNLTADASRTLTLGGYSLSFLDSNADNIAVIQATGNQFFGGTFSIRTHSATTAPTLRLASGTSSDYTGIKSPDTLAASVVYILPTGYGNAGDVLSVEAAGASTQQMKWTGGGADVILSGGGKVEMTTSSDASARALLFGGADGFNDSNWNVLAGPNSPGSSLGTPGTTTLSCDPVSVMNALFRSPKSGDINISGTVKFSAGTNSSTNTFVRVYKVPAAFVTDMENGDDPGTSISCTLVAAIQVDTPSLNVDTRPRNYISTNGVSISSGDYVFATYSYRGRLTSTQYFTHNFQLVID